MRRPRWPLKWWRVPDWPGGDGKSTGPVILLYHSIADVGTDPFGIRVRPRNFAEQMAVIARHCRPMRLDHLGDALVANNIPPRSVVITFDDGFADNLHIAKPVLEQHSIPATIFVSSGYLDQACEFWWDELDRIVLQAGHLPRNLHLRIGESEYAIDLGDAARYGRWAAWRCRRWKVWQQPYPTPRHRAYHEIWELLRCSTPQVRETALDELRKWAGMDKRGRANRLCCTTSQLRELASSDLIEIGAHTVTHPSLAALPLHQQREEIAKSKSRLEDLLGETVASFSYPFGARSDYTVESIELLTESGFVRACSNFPPAEALTAQTDPFQWPRRVVLDWGGREFAARLAGWFGTE